MSSNNQKPISWVWVIVAFLLGGFLLNMCSGDSTGGTTGGTTGGSSSGDTVPSYMGGDPEGLGNPAEEKAEFEAEMEKLGISKECEEDMRAGVPAEYSRCSDNTRETDTQPKVVESYEQGQEQECEELSISTQHVVGDSVCIQGTLGSILSGYRGWRINLNGIDAAYIDEYPTGLMAGRCAQVIGVVEQAEDSEYVVVRADAVEQPCSGSSSRSVQSSPAGNLSCPNGCTKHVDGCDIKGNISFTSGEKIYHMPGQEYYTATTIDPAYGERWFCTEQEAIANGWRKSWK